MKHGTKTLLKYSTLSSAKNILGIDRNAPKPATGQKKDSEIQKRAAKSTDSYHHSALTYQQKHPESDPMHYLVEKHQLNSTIRYKNSKVKETEKNNPGSIHS